MDITPTPDDLGRDLLADLAVCEAATPPDWRVLSDAAINQIRGLFPEHLPEGCTVIERPPATRQEAMQTFFEAVLVGSIAPHDAAFVAAARAGWPAAIRCALAARAANNAGIEYANELTERLHEANRKANAAQTLNSNQRVMLDQAGHREAELEKENARLRNLCRSLEAARDERDTYRRDLEEIGRLIGCGHIEDGLSRCVREALERRPPAGAAEGE